MIAICSGDAPSHCFARVRLRGCRTETYSFWRRIPTMECTPSCAGVLITYTYPIALFNMHAIGQVIMVCISDGRANVPLSVSNGEPVSTVCRQPSSMLLCVIYERLKNIAPYALCFSCMLQCFPSPQYCAGFDMPEGGAVWHPACTC